MTYPSCVCVCMVHLHFPPFWHCKMVWAHLPSSCPSPSLSHFSKGSWFLLLETGIRNQDLGTRCSCYWGFLTAQPSQQTEQGSIVSCVCARMCVCVSPSALTQSELSLADLHPPPPPPAGRTWLLSFVVPSRNCIILGSVYRSIRAVNLCPMGNTFI